VIAALPHPFPMQADESPAPVGEEAYPCWACGVLVQVPLVLVPVAAAAAPPAAAAAAAARAQSGGGLHQDQQQQQLVPARAYACGWCGAVNDAALRDTHPEGARGRPDGSAAARYPGFTDDGGGGARGVVPPGRARRRATDNVGVGSSNNTATILLAAASSSLLALLRYAVVAAVVALVAGIVGAGILFVLPALYTPSALPPSWRSFPPSPRGRGGGAPLLLQLHTLLALWLGSNVLFYYARSAVSRPGPVRACNPLPARLQAGGAGGGGGGVGGGGGGGGGDGTAGGCYYPRGCWSGWKWCGRCRFPKPPRAHHCRTCAQCVVDLDHHCVFLARCVGRGNQRAFLLFLFFAAAANAYVALQTTRLLWRDRQTVAWVLRRASDSSPSSSLFIDAAASSALLPQRPHQDEEEPRGWAAAAGPEGSARARRLARLTLGVFAALAEAPAPLLAAFYLLAVALATVLGTGMLLQQQADNLARGTTYVAELKGQLAGVGVPASGQQQQAGGGRLPDEPREEERAARRQRRQRLWLALCDVMGREPGGPARWLLVPRWDAPNLALFPGAAADGKGE
jgi:hypothetical protein